MSDTQLIERLIYLFVLLLSGIILPSTRKAKRLINTDPPFQMGNGKKEVCIPIGLGLLRKESTKYRMNR